MSTMIGAGTNVWPLLSATLLPNVGGWISSYLAMKDFKTWYPKIVKPSWTPPDYAFGPVWTVLYTGMGYASYLVWKTGGFQNESGSALVVYGIQLVLNWAWSPIFFRFHSIKWGLVDMLALSGTASFCALSFYQVDKTAGLLMLPYLAWLGVAGSLNYSIWLNNQDNKDIE